MAVVLASCTSSSPTASPGGSDSITTPSPTGGASTEADSVTKIEAAEGAGTIDHDTALLYELYAALDYASLPVEFQSSDPATPEATGILAELSTRLSSLSAELQAKVAPYFLRPDDPDSFWKKGPATTAAAPGSIRLAAMSLVEYKISLIDYKYIDATDTAVRVWYPVCSALVPVEDCHDPAGAAPFVERAQQLADEIDSSAMWDLERTAMLGHEPCTDATSANNGGGGRLDIYLVVPFVGLDWGGREGTLDSSTYGKTLAGAAVPEPTGQPGCPATSHIILDANRPFDRLKSTAAHELFHAFQFSFKNAALGDRDWWAEASATWASDLVYRSLNYEQEYLKGYWSMAGGKDEGPLDNTAGMAEYGAYLWPFYLVQKSGDATGTAVGRLWQASETVSPIQAMGQLPGWSDSFKEFALWNWNKESFSVKYVDGSAQISAAKLSQDTTCMLGSGKTNCLLKLGKDTMQFFQGPTTVQYYEGVPDQAVQLLKFDLTELQGKPGLGIQAILSIGGDAGTKVEDWTALSDRTFCVKSDDLRKIVLVVSNSSLTSDLTGAIKVEATAAGCYLTGTLTFHTKLIHDADYPDGYVTKSDTTTIQARLVLGLATPSAMYFGDDGSTLAYQADYTSPGSDALCPYEDHRSATGTFNANNGGISAIYTTGDDGSPQLMDLTYWFDSAGTHVFNGCGPDEPFEGARVTQFGCDARDPVGLPVASSPSGTIFDFGCTNNAFIDPVSGGVSLIEISGTLTPGP
ncbi:MAG: hypothetical protein M3R57_09280 [Chloroflexota bacterium]|nr:hypothetical protein [Chloroflexota bacterium]